MKNSKTFQGLSRFFFKDLIIFFKLETHFQHKNTVHSLMIGLRKDKEEQDRDSREKSERVEFFTQNWSITVSETAWRSQKELHFSPKTGLEQCQRQQGEVRKCCIFHPKLVYNSVRDSRLGREHNYCPDSLYVYHNLSFQRLSGTVVFTAFKGLSFQGLEKGLWQFKDFQGLSTTLCTLFRSQVKPVRRI